MLTAKQLEERRGYLGASDAAGVLSLSRWSTPLSIWAEKTGTVPKEDISNVLAVKLGHLLEDDMTELFEEQTSKKLHRVNETKFHPVYPFIAANLDRRIVGENVPVELKTCAAFKSKEWDGDEIPREYIIQCMHTLAVTGKPYMYLGVLIGSQDFQIKKVDRDVALIDDLISKEVAFWKDFVETGIMPKVVTHRDAETLADLFTFGDPSKVVNLTDDAQQKIEILDGYLADKKQLDKMIETLKNELKLMLGNAEIGTTPTGGLVSWKNHETSRLNGEALLKDHPEIHAKYYEKTSIRRFSYKLMKGA